jgi:sarcosine oxidase subunit beta
MRRTAEVVIVGGGCMGASVAYHLARRGVTDVVLVEREAQLATGSTGRNAGGVRHQFSHRSNIELSIESIRTLERFEDEVGTPIDFHQDGYLFLLSSEAAVAAFGTNVALQRQLGVAVDWLDAGAAARLAPGLDVGGVLADTYCARDGIADPNGVTMGFAAAARRAGVEFACGTEVTGIDVACGRVVAVETSRGRVETRRVIVATGAWTQGVAGFAGLDVPIQPLRRHIFLAQPGDGTTWDQEPHRGRVPSTRLMVIDFETTFYFHREGGRLLFGMGDPAERPGFDITVRWDFLPSVVSVAAARLPALLDAEVSHAWAGLYEMTPDGLPVIGPAPSCEGVYVIAGFCGHGFQHSPAAGRVLADLITGRDPGIDLSPFALARFRGGGEQGTPTLNAIDGGERNVV